VSRRARICFVLVLALATIGASARDAAPGTSGQSWLVRADKDFQRVGEYVSRGRNTYVQGMIEALGAPSGCRVVGSRNHAVFTWPTRGIWVEAWTYGYVPEGENGCISPDLIHVSEIRLRDPRWTTSLGLHVGDGTMKLRRLYPRAQYYDRSQKFRRNEYWLVVNHGPCIGICTPFEEQSGVDYPRLTAEVRNGRVVSFWVPVFGQGE